MRGVTHRIHNHTGNLSKVLHILQYPTFSSIRLHSRLYASVTPLNDRAGLASVYRRGIGGSDTIKRPMGA